VKTILVIGAGRYQRAVIRRAKALGYRVVAVDRNPDAPGFQYADVGRIVDFSDAEAVLEAIADLEIDGVTTVQSDRAVPVIARVAAERGLPGVDAETARAMTHKATMRERLAAAGVPQPRFVALGSPDGVEQAAAEVGFPAVLKPVDASGQFGVFRVESASEVAERLQETLSVSPTGDAILEEFAEGVEMNGIVVVRDGEPISVTLCDRLHPPGRSFGVSWIHLFPPSVAGERLEEAERVAVEATRALGLEHGVSFPQLIATPDGRVVVVECAARIGGLMAELMEHALGIDLLQVQLRIALGEEVPDELVRERFRRPLAVRFLTAEPGPLRAGTVKRIGSLEPVLAAPGVLEAALYPVEGEVIRPVMVISDRRGYVIATGDTRDEALARAEAAALLVDLEVEAA
jgi:biotin carboxylase